MSLGATSPIRKWSLTSAGPYSFDDSCTFGDPRSYSPGSSLPYLDRGRSISPSARSQSDSKQAPLPPKAHEARRSICFDRGAGASELRRKRKLTIASSYSLGDSIGGGTDQFWVTRRQRESLRQGGKTETPPKPGQSSLDRGKDTSDAQGADMSPFAAKNASPAPHAVLHVPGKGQNDVSRQDTFRPRYRRQTSRPNPSRFDLDSDSTRTLIGHVCSCR